MSIESGNSNDLEPNDFNSQNPVAARRRGADGHPELVDSEDQRESELPPIKTSDKVNLYSCLLYTSPSPRVATLSRMPSSA